MARIGIAVALVVALGLGGILGLAASRPAPSASATASPSPTLSPSLAASASTSPSPSAAAARCPLNGVPLAAPIPANRVALLVQVENHPLGRPARNLGQADIVIESTVEGDVTRFTALFYCQPTLGLTGPIRSARYYNIDLWQQMHALTVAFGASTPARRRFAAAGMPQVNGLINSGAWFRRYGTAPAPHNLYGDLEALRSAATRDALVRGLAAQAGTLRPPFVIGPTAEPPAGAAVSEVTISTTPFWHFGWRWDAGLAAWRRTDAGLPVTDAATGLPLTATSVIVQRITESIVYDDPDPGGNARRDLHLVGHGVGTLFVDGRAIAVRWSRPSAGAVTSWTYADGSPMVLPPGHIWWELVPSIGTVTQR
jgi:hypothetical protein